MQSQALGSLGYDLHLKACQDTFHGFYRNILTDQRIDLLVSHLNRIRFRHGRINILYSTRDLTSRQLLYQQGGTFQYIHRIVRIQTTLEAERSVRIQAKTTGGHANPRRMETSGFQEYVGGLLRHAGIQTAEHATDTHRFLDVTNHQVTIGQRTLHAIQRDEFRTSLGRLDNHFISFDLTRIKRV